MTGITHKQAQRYLCAAADGLLHDDQRAILDAHLRDCASCRAEADELNALEARLRKNLQARWNAHDGPSKNMTVNIQSRSWRIIMTNRINVGFSALAGIAALVVLGFAINYVALNLAKTSTAANETRRIGNASPALSSQTERLSAFVSEKNGNPDIYTIHADGSGLTNLTNNPANDLSPVWSPDGTHIAFESDRTGLKQIFVMNADGSNVTQLTDGAFNYGFSMSDGSNYNPWSPNGKKLIFSQKVSKILGEETQILYIMDASGENKKPLVNGADIYYFPSWSPDGKHIAFVALDYLGANIKGRIYVTDANGDNLTDVTRSLPAAESLDQWNYSWTGGAESISFITHKIMPDTENNKIDIWSAYEASLDGNTLVMNATARSPIEGYRDGTYFSIQSSVFTWVSEKGKVFEAYPLKKCQALPDSTTSGRYSYKQSSNGNMAVVAYCSNGDIWLSWVNSKGTVFMPLIDAPIHAPEGSVEVAWSPDDKFIAFNIASASKTDTYIMNVSESLKDPSIQLVRVNDGAGSFSYSLTWQSVVLTK